MSGQTAAQADRTPDWDMSAYFPEMGGDAYLTFRQTLENEMQTLLQAAHALTRIEQSSLSAWIDLLQRLEQVTARNGHLSSYLGCMGAADAGDETVQRETASAKAARAGNECPV